MSEARKKLTPVEGKTWPRPVIVPLPLQIAGVDQPVRPLNGTWKLNPHPPAEFWSPQIDPGSWMDVDVPRSVETYGLEIAPDIEYAYRRQVQIPAEFSGKRVLLRFDGASCFARVWVDGVFVRSHYGGYTSWDCDISDYVQPGQTVDLTVGVTHKPQEISPFQVGGLIREVKLLALPQDYATRLHVETDFDDQYRDAVLKITAGMSFHAHSSAQVRLSLEAPDGHAVELPASIIALNTDNPEAALEVAIPQPAKWDAEHPHLYLLRAQVVVEGEVVEELSRRVGFRKIVRDGNRLLVNGRPVKLRGVNRHDIYPTTGRGVTPGLLEQDVRLFKAANVNFIRTSHYPPRDDFLDVCDRLGMYVEDEIAVAFVYQSIRPTESDPEFTEKYLGQFAEMIERDRSHACVLMWSLCNESYWGSNFQQEYDYARREDSTRPLIFSYPITIPEGVGGYDIFSLHYAEWDRDPADRTDNHSIGNAWGKDYPVLHDEYVHVACYDYAEKMRDPAVREMWGESIKRFWESILATEGALGGAIWAGIDEIMITPTGYRGWEWGIIDGWRREKPEHWLTKKAYSPIRIADQSQANPGAGRTLEVQVQNWFDHTNLSEVQVLWAVGADSGAQAGPRIEPHAAGGLSIGPRDWRDGDVLNLKFIGADGVLVDEYSLPVGAEAPAAPTVRGLAPHIVGEGGSVSVVGRDFHLRFNRITGLIEEGFFQGERVIESGPHLNLVGINLPEWRLAEFSTVVEQDEAVVRLAGSYGEIKVRFELRVDGSGSVDTTYWLDSLPFHPPRARKLGVGLDVGGYREVGVAFTLPNTVDRLSWKRKGQWSVYPDDHISRASGVAYKTRTGGSESFGVQPEWNWAEDMRDFPLFGMYDVGGRGTKDFFSMKHNIYFASAAIRGSDARVRVESDAADSVRLEILPHLDATIDDRDERVHFVGSWMELDGDAKNYLGTETISNKAGDYVDFTFQGSGICWIGAKDMFYGTASVYIDGVKQPTDIDLYYSMPISTSRGEEKNYRQVLFSKEGLPEGEHTIRIVTTGQKNARSSNSYVSIDAFVVLGNQPEGKVRLNINNLWNYPELTWGNYVKDPIHITSGYTNSVHFRLTNNDLNE